MNARPQILLMLGSLNGGSVPAAAGRRVLLYGHAVAGLRRGHLPFVQTALRGPSAAYTSCCSLSRRTFSWNRSSSTAAQRRAHCQGQPLQEPTLTSFEPRSGHVEERPSLRAVNLSFATHEGPPLTRLGWNESGRSRRVTGLISGWSRSAYACSISWASVAQSQYRVAR